ncbi:hypothetical protein AB0F43_31620 [Kribbella sp. NPDC023972]|uniref:hypothetical protein n=1 Tax=Kribbella sp. NPDC023972 TaxID=3154795 RepID=UPI0033CA64FD
MTALQSSVESTELPVAEVAQSLPMRYREPGRGYVQVPVEMLKEKAETVLVVSMLARRLRASSGGVVEGVLQAHLAYELGWIERDCDASPVVANRLSGWVRGAASTSWLDVQHNYDARRRRTMARYRLWGRPSIENAVEYVVAPVELFDMVRDGVIDKHGFLAWLRWRAVMGSASSTTKSVPEWAKKWGVSVATARRHRGALLKAGVLTEIPSDGEASITALDPSLASSGSSESPDSTPLKNHEPPPLKSVSRPCQESGPSVPTGVPKGVSLLASAVADVQEVTRETATTASPSQKPDSRDVTQGRRQASPSALAAAGRLLPRFRAELVRCEAHYRRGIIRRTALFIEAGYGPEALVRAANELTVDVIDGNHNDAFRTALATLAVDVRLGACRGCGRDADDFGHHPDCEHAPATWFEEVTQRETCVSCGRPGGVRRNELPMPIVVCDGCWTTLGQAAQDLDPQSDLVDEIRTDEPSSHGTAAVMSGSGGAGEKHPGRPGAGTRNQRPSQSCRHRRRSSHRTTAPRWHQGAPAGRCSHLRGPPDS